MSANAKVSVSAVHKTGKEPDTEFTNILIESLNYLIDEAENSKLRVPARIIRSARSDILNWANYAYPAGDERDKLVNSAAEHDGLLIAVDLISKYAAVRDTKLKKQIYDSLSKIDKKRKFTTVNGGRKK